MHVCARVCMSGWDTACGSFQGPHLPSFQGRRGRGRGLALRDGCGLWPDKALLNLWPNRLLSLSCIHSSFANYCASTVGRPEATAVGIEASAPGLYSLSVGTEELTGMRKKSGKSLTAKPKYPKDLEHLQGSETVC